MKNDLKESPVITNIKAQVESGEFNGKVETGDPVISPEKSASILKAYVRSKRTMWGKFCTRMARSTMWAGTRIFNLRTHFDGMENIKGYKGGAIITSNHFNPLDNTIVRETMLRAYHEGIFIVSQESNFAMNGLLGFFMKYVDTIPITDNLSFMKRYFVPTLARLLKHGRKILIYPEQEMWVNYRKPRPLKRGAYYYAAQNMVPIISCFVEIETIPGKKTVGGFYRNRYTMHVLPMIWPDPAKSVRENSKNMMETDYQQKKDAYEKAYGKPLDYTFEPWDIAGWEDPEIYIKEKETAGKEASEKETSDNEVSEEETAEEETPEEEPDGEET